VSLQASGLDVYMLVVCILYICPTCHCNMPALCWQVWMSKSVGCDVPIHVIMLALYIELQLGVYGSLHWSTCWIIYI